MALQMHQQARPPGKVVVEVLFRLRLTLDTSRKRRPDIAFVSFERWASDRPMSSRDNAWDVVPDLAVEVISPTDLAQQLLQKVLEYFQAGVRLVWVVYPEQRQIYSYESPTQIRVLTVDDTLDGGEVLPGFQLPLNKLFDPIAPPGDAS
jgi:Uma2 family endonuclease